MPLLCYKICVFSPPILLGFLSVQKWQRNPTIPIHEHVRMHRLNRMQCPSRFTEQHTQEMVPQKKRKHVKQTPSKTPTGGLLILPFIPHLLPNPQARLVAIVSSFLVTSFTEPQLMKMCFNGSCGSLRGAFVDRQPWQGLKKKP